MKITVDYSDVALMIKKLENVDKTLLSQLKMAAMEERRTHRYINRTGRLERETKASMVRSSRNRAVGELVMNTDYASYIVQRGFSSIERIAIETQRYLNDIFQKF